MKNKKTAILITSIVCGVIVLIAGVYLLLAFVFPYTLAREVYDMGFNPYALTLYDRAYNKDNDNIDALYMALNLSIKLDRNESTEKYFEEFYAKPNYANYVVEIDKSNAKKDVKPLIKSTLLSEDNYLKNHYVKALVALGKVDKAIEFCENSLVSNPMTFNMSNYYYSNFAIDSLTTQQLNFLLDDGVYDSIKTYYESLSTDFETNYALDRVPERICAGNRIITVGNNLLYFDARFSNTLLSNEEKTEIMATIESTKQAINLLIME